MAETSKGITPRRGARNKKLSLKAIESVYISQFSKQSNTVLQNESTSEEDSFDEDKYEANKQKPTVIGETVDVQGNQIFTFAKAYRKKALGLKVQQALEQAGTNTPNSFRNKMKKGIQSKIVEANTDSEHDYSDSGSEYVASGNSESDEPDDSDEESQSSENSDSSSGASRKQAKNPKLKQNIAALNTKSTKKRQNTNNYVIKTDEYFSNNATKKIITSNHTLDKLETPRLPQDQLQKLIKNMTLTDEHEKCVKNLSSNSSVYSKWWCLLYENFNVLVYGLGSKRSILHEFQSTFLSNLPVIVVNGFFPTLSIKDILDGIIVDLLELKENPANVYEACELIENEFSHISNTHLYLVVHNIDGDMLRNGKAQNVLARLAAVKNIHLIASIDHINAPLIWDHTKLSKFNYTWWDMTSFLPYIDETSFESSMMVQRTGTLALSSLRNVFLSLTTNSKGIYLIIAKYQLEHGKNQYYQGLAFKDLYWSCREAFLVSSDLALRAQLTEFVDHKMIKFRRSVEGVELVNIPIPNPLLQKFLDEQN